MQVTIDINYRSRPRDGEGSTTGVSHLDPKPPETAGSDTLNPTSVALVSAAPNRTPMLIRI